MNKKDLTEIIAERLNISQFNAELIIDRFLRNMIYTLRKNEKISISGFGVFENMRYESKSVVNPRTKEKMLVLAYNKVRFKPGQLFLNKLNEKQR